MVDWTKPIEAVHVSGKVVPVSLQDPVAFGGTNPDCEGDWWTNSPFDSGRQCWKPDGSVDDGWNSFAHEWKIRNCAEPANDELAELRAFKEAAIARFPELAPVDPDLLEAREICAKNVDSHNPLMIEPYRNGEYDHHWLMRCVREGIERGRELERYAQGLTTPND